MSKDDLTTLRMLEEQLNDIRLRYGLILGKDKGLEFGNLMFCVQNSILRLILLNDENK